MLLDPNNSEDTTSSILSVLRPFDSSITDADMSPVEIAELLFAEEETRQGWVVDNIPLVNELKRRRELLAAVESYLMANREASILDNFRTEAASLCEQTFAFATASEPERFGLRLLFTRLAESISALVDEPEQQAAFGQTLLSAEKAKLVFDWVTEHRISLLEATTNASLLAVLWPLLEMTFEDRVASSMEPASAAFALASAWIEGSNYQQLFDFASEEEITKPYGGGRRKLAEDDLFKLLNSTFAFDSALIVAAVGQFLGLDDAGQHTPIGVFLKTLKYGVPDELAISAYEAGFADRAVAQLLRDQMRSAGFGGEDFREALSAHADVAAETILPLPSYFTDVLVGLRVIRTGGI
ncbi:hypothetical protein [Specibacter cremeus]|uniref:hypothetical protein n=1 Tax=Specibacter cremeus TaxID=1629051 RepID=UPI000F79680F|nr:hypothetical protein [Specibacter cremeus]